MKLYADYESLVLQEYKKRKAGKQVSSGDWLYPTRCQTAGMNLWLFAKKGMNKRDDRTR